MILLSVQCIHGQDLSKYQNFSFGMRLVDLSEQVDQKAAEANLIHQRPALIQELTSSVVSRKYAHKVVRSFGEWNRR
jgi:hypothetical protein